jgi:hypothetical protein
MKHFEKLTEVAPSGTRIVAVFTDGRYLIRGTIWETGNWPAGRDRTFDVVVIYLRQNMVNSLYLGDYVDTLQTPEKRRVIFRLRNVREIGFTNSNWKHFADNGGFPVRMIE